MKELKIVDALVSPILLYACEVIKFDKNDNIGKVHVQFLKNILRVRTTTPNYLVDGILLIIIHKTKPNFIKSRFNQFYPFEALCSINVHNI
jgi:hypothetical protein